MARKDGGMRSLPPMTRYAVQPLGGGSYGIYDRNKQEFTETFRGRGARQKADRKWRTLAGVS